MKEFKLDINYDSLGDLIFTLQSLLDELKDIKRKIENKKGGAIPIPKEIIFVNEPLLDSSSLALCRGNRKLSYDSNNHGWDCYVTESNDEDKRVPTELVPIDPRELEEGDWFVYKEDSAYLGDVTLYNLYEGNGESVRFNRMGQTPLGCDTWKLSGSKYFKVVPR